MPIDPSIALGVKPMQVKSQGEYLNELYNQQNAEQTNQLNMLKMQDIQRANERQAKWDTGAAGLNPSAPNYETDRFRLYAGQGPEGLKAYAATLREEAQAKSADVETAGKKITNATAAQTMAAKSFNDIYNRPDENNLNALYDDAVDSGLYDKTMLANMKRRKDTILAIPVGEIDPATGRPDFSARRKAIDEMQLEAKDRIPKPSNLAILQNELAALSPTDSRRAALEAAIKKEST